MEAFILVVLGGGYDTTLVDFTAAQVESGSGVGVDDAEFGDERHHKALLDDGVDEVIAARKRRVKDHDCEGCAVRYLIGGNEDAAVAGPKFGGHEAG